jgi:hypothetical protein
MTWLQSTGSAVKRRTHGVAWFAVFLAGCSQSATNHADDKGDGGEPRFANAVIYRTIAPWDGAAVQLFLSEKPLTQGAPDKPRVSVRIYQSASEVSKKRVHLDSKESRAGLAAWIADGGKAEPVTVDIDFEEVTEGKPVKGKYDVTLPDGKRERGRFEAKWWKAEGPGG